MKKSAVILHPFIFAVYPILFFYTHNISEEYFGSTFLSLGISLIVSIFFWLIFNLILKNKRKSAIVVTLLIFFFFSYGRVVQLFEGKEDLLSPVVNYILISLVFLIWIFLIILIKRSKKDFKIATKILNIIAVVLLFLNVMNIVLYELSRKKIQLSKINESKTAITNDSVIKESHPDIYYILLDEFASSSTIKDIFDYDNSDFEKFLLDKGFFIAHESKINTVKPWTPLIMACILNMEQIKSNEINQCYKLMKNSKVVDILKSKAYTIYNFPMRYYEEKTSPMTKADSTFGTSYGKYKGPAYKLSNFNNELLKTTVFRKFIKDYYRKSLADDKKYDNIYANYISFTFNKLKKIPEYQSPKFIYAHIECPHNPYVFDRDGKRIGIKWDGMKYYLDQYIFTTKIVEETINEILKKSAEPPVIIIQSDHGTFQTKKGSKLWVGTKPEHTQNIFNAIYLPGISYEFLNVSLVPENTFRIVFNSYFNTNYELIDK